MPDAIRVRKDARPPVRKISILIPVYNEERYIAQVLDAVCGARLPHDLEKEVVVVDDGSLDRTRDILARYERLRGMTICHLPRNAGKGAAIRRGLEHVSGDVVVIQDADLEYSVDDYGRLLEPFISGGARVVYGSRFRGDIRGMRLANRAFNLLIRWLVNVLFEASITDEATAYKLIDTSLLRSLELTSTRFEICPEITAKVLRRKVPIHEVPVSYRARTRAQGKKVRWVDAFEAVYTLLKYRWIGGPT